MDASIHAVFPTDVGSARLIRRVSCPPQPRCQESRLSRVGGRTMPRRGIRAVFPTDAGSANTMGNLSLIDQRAVDNQLKPLAQKGGGLFAHQDAGHVDGQVFHHAGGFVHL